MSEALFERYKDALRRGHVAALRGQPDEALEAYAEAAAIAPDRPLPHTSSGTVLVHLGRVDDGLTSFAAALARGPRDEGALLGRAEALVLAGRAADAAESLDLAVEVREAAGRTSEALESACRALELAESPSRRRCVERLVLLLGDRVADGGPGSEVAGPVLARAAALLNGDPLAPPMVGSPPGDRVAGGPAVGVPYDEPASDADRVVATDPVVERPPAESAGSHPAPPAPDPSFDEARALTIEGDRALDAGDRLGARDALLAAARADGAAGRFDAALDACYRSLAVAPDDVALHLELVRLYRARGWVGLAAEKMALLGRLVDLSGTPDDVERVRAMRQAELPGDLPAPPA
ncbi:MAG: hypothetical protein ACHQ15_08925 [Candidatus Limnocylindrales bacterium]